MASADSAAFSPPQKRHYLPVPLCSHFVTDIKTEPLVHAGIPAQLSAIEKDLALVIHAIEYQGHTLVGKRDRHGYILAVPPVFISRIMHACIAQALPKWR